MTKWILGSVGVVLCLYAGLTYSRQADYNRNLDQFNLSVRSYDRDGAEQGLEAIKASYVDFSKMGLQYFADRFWFKDMYLYEGAVLMVNEDYKKIADDPNWIKGHEDDYRAYNFVCVAKFNVLYVEYQSEAVKKDKLKRADVINRVVKEVSPDCKVAVEKGPGPAVDYDPSYNYDLTSNPADAQKALESPKPMPRFMMGLKVEGKGPKGEEPDPKFPLGNQFDESAPGGGGARKKG